MRLIIQAQPQQLSNIYSMILNLAQHEGVLDRIKITEGRLGELLFCDKPNHFVALAMIDETIVGFTMYNVNHGNICYNVTPGLYIENLFIQQKYRNQGMGKALLAYVASQAKAQGFTRIEWWVSSHNKSAINFYKKIGGRNLDELLTFRCDGGSMIDLIGGINEVS